MFAAGVRGAGHRAALAAFVVAGCAWGATAGGLLSIEASAQAIQSARPAFFVEWRTDIPGLTSRPSLDPETRIPDYPSAALRAGLAGTTVLNACVTTEGRLADVRISGSSGSPVLDQATIEWASQARFKPAKFGNEAVAMCGFPLEYQWRLEN